MTYFEELSKALENLWPRPIERFYNLMMEASESGWMIYVCGNGGSAATANHFAEDLSVTGSKHAVDVISAISLSSNASMITCIANDFGYQYIFSSQLNFCARDNDILVAISGSGNSPNVVNAVKTGKALGMKVVTMTGFDGGVIRPMGDICIHVQSENYGIIEDCHLAVCHSIIDSIKRGE